MNGLVKPTWLLVGLTVAVVASPCEGQNTLPAQMPPAVQTPPLAQLPVGTQTSPAGASDYSVSQVGPDSLTWKSSSGQSVTTIATGMNFWDGQQWSASDPSFAISQDGTAFVANKILAPVQIAANLNSQGAVTVTTPDGVLLRSTPIAIALYDTVSGLSVIVASLTNTTGVLVDAQHVVYNQAFVGGGFSASVVYSLPDTGSFHQDVVFTGFNPNFDPTVWGFAAASTNSLQIEIISEFFNPPQPQVRERDLYIEQDPNVRAQMASPDFIDYFLDFGHYVFGPGKAYPTSVYGLLTPGVSVAKDFVTSGGRTFLVESIPYRNLAPQLQTLPPVQVKTSSLKQLPGARRMKVAAASLPQLQAIKSQAKEKITPAKAVAMASTRPQGIDVDYVATVSSLTESTLYTSDSTYFVSGNVYLTSPVTIESAVFKFPTNAVGALVVEGTLTMATTNYRPAIFTAADDNTAGAPLSTNIWTSYTGTVGYNFYGDAVLYFLTSSNIALNNLRFSYLLAPICIGADTAGLTATISHAQMFGCGFGLYLGGGNVGGIGTDSLTLTVNNCLMEYVTEPFLAYAMILSGNACNCTFDSISQLLVTDSYSTGSFNFTNSIFSSVASNATPGSVALGGGHNGFYNSTSFGSSALPGGFPFQGVGAGSHYLASNSPFLTNGTTNIDGALLAQLRMKTTQAPAVLSPAPQFTVDTVLSPVVQRDTTGLAIGFHYDPIDYIGACSVSNATLTFAPGTAIAYLDNCFVWLQDGSRVVSTGTPNQRNYIIYYTLVQEGPEMLWSGTVAQAQPFAPSPYGSSAIPSISLRLTSICAPTGETSLWNTADFGAGQSFSSLTLQDCEVYGSGANWQMTESADTPSVGFTNNVFYRVPFAVNSNAKISSFNNLFYGTTNTNEFAISILHRSGAPSPNTHENNVFDGVTATLDGMVGYNAYLHGATNTAFTNNFDLVTNLTWQGGPLGSFYQPTNSPLIANGSTFATNLGFYHYTVTTNEAVEGTNIVSRGYHYAAVGTSNLPLDYNGDGFPDYLQDANGNGVVDSGEIDWLVAGDLGLTVIITQPVNNSVIP